MCTRAGLRGPALGSAGLCRMAARPMPQATAARPSPAPPDRALPGAWEGLVVLCAANSWDAVKMMDRHLAERLAELAPVLYVDPPVSRLTPLRTPALAGSVRRPGLRLVAPSLARLTPVVLPGPLRPGMAPVSAALVRRTLRRAVARLGGSLRALVATMPLVPVLGACGEPLSVFWAQDDFAGGAALLGQSADRLRRGELRQAAAADLV